MQTPLSIDERNSTLPYLTLVSDLGVMQIQCTRICHELRLRPWTLLNSSKNLPRSFGSFSRRPTPISIVATMSTVSTTINDVSTQSESSNRPFQVMLFLLFPCRDLISRDLFFSFISLIGCVSFHDLAVLSDLLSIYKRR